EFQAVAVGDEGYTSAGSTLFYAGKYYTQIVSTSDDPKFAAFALDLAKRVAEKQKPGGAGSPRTAPRGARPAGHPAPAAGLAASASSRESKPATAETKPAAAVTPATYFALLPAKDREGEAKYVAQDVFGYSFLSDVFMADYKEGDVTWQGF